MVNLTKSVTLAKSVAPTGRIISITDDGYVFECHDMREHLANNRLPALADYLTGQSVASAYYVHI
jgi:hypothetical protein